MAVGDWVPCVNYGASMRLEDDLGLGTLVQLDMILVQTGDDQGLVGEVGVVEQEAEVLVKRVVGWVAFRFGVANDMSLRIHERIRVGLLTDNGALSFYATALNDASQANEPFLWERVSHIEAASNAADPAVPSAAWPQPDVGHPGWGQIDVRVARRLRRQDVLIYSVQVDTLTVQAFDGADQIRVFPYLRSWARGLN